MRRDEAAEKYCPFSFGNPCINNLCMAWHPERDPDTGRDLQSGWCKLTEAIAGVLIKGKRS